MQHKQQAIFIADLGFGDAGKGTITDFLAEQLDVHTVVRYNGGPQAAHTVVTRDGRQHTFAQFSSGTFQAGVHTLLSRFMLVNPLNMLKEERHLRECGVTDAFERMLIDRRALVITPFQKALNRLRETARGTARHGSCGEGIGECMADSLAHEKDVLYAGGLQDRDTLMKKLTYIRDLKRSELAALLPHLPRTEAVRQECSLFTDPAMIEACADIYRDFTERVQLLDDCAIRNAFKKEGMILFEGAQGVLLDENYGFTPYTTWSTTTFANAQTIVQEHDYCGDILKLGVLRTYATRHGAGPFPTEEPSLAPLLPESHNGWNDWQQTFRVGYCDLVATRYAKRLIGELDLLALTHVDRLRALPERKVCTSYHYHGSEQGDLQHYFECEGTNIRDINVHPTIDLTHQEQLTQRLLACSPEYRTIPACLREDRSQAEELAFFALLEEQLETPIGIVSRGQTAADKQFTSAAHFQGFAPTVSVHMPVVS